MQRVITISGTLMRLEENGHGVSVTIKATDEEAAAARAAALEILGENVDGYMPAWVRDDTPWIAAGSRYRVPMKADGYIFDQVRELVQAMGSLKRSPVVITVLAKNDGGKAGVFLKAIVFQEVMGVKMENFFGGDNDDN